MPNRLAAIGGGEMALTLSPKAVNASREALFPPSWTPEKESRYSAHDSSKPDTASRAASAASAALRTAVTTHCDEFSVFEDQLLTEVNLLRQNPRGYAVLFEAEASIGYPYVCPDDLYFESEERVMEQFAVKPPPKAMAVEKHGKNHRSERDKSGASDEGEESAPLHNVTEKKRDHNRPHSARSTHLAAERDPLAAALQMLENESHSHLKPPSTMRDCGMNELNVEQLRTFFLRHQKYRMLLEKAVRDLLHQWQVADLAQHDAWAAEDAQASKKIKRGGRKKSISNFATDDVSRQRSTLSDQLSHKFLERLKVLMWSLCKSRDTCKRAMDAANLILDCIRALKEAKPVPLLRGSRGLKLAARDTSQYFHRRPEEIELVFQVHKTAVESVCPSRLPPMSATAIPPTREAGANEHRPSLDDGMPCFDSRNAAEAVRYFEDLWSPATSNHSNDERSSSITPKDTNAPPPVSLGLEPTNHLKAYIHALADVTQGTCEEYGYVSGEVRGVQLYGAGTARSLVMKTLLGVAVPIFGFRELHPIANRSGSSPRPEREQRSAAKHQRVKIVAHQEDHLGSTIFDQSIFNVEQSPDEEVEEHQITERVRNDGQNFGSATRYPAATSTKTTTGLMFGGQFHPTSLSAATFVTAEEASENTSAGKRAALAAQRLGPLLWRDAHLLGCGWQRVVPEKPVPEYDERETAPIPRATNHDVVVSTTMVVASGYEELDIIEQHKHMSLAEVRRVVRFEEENELMEDGISATGTTGGDLSSSVGGPADPDRPAVVDLHSSLDVSLIYPTKHPIRVEEKMQTAWLALRANPQQVRLVATLTGAQEARQQSPILNAAELLVQPSRYDAGVILVLLNVAAAKAKAKDGKVLVHLFECDKNRNGESGFEHIGFVRITLPTTGVAAGGAVERSNCITPSPTLLSVGSPMSAGNRLRSSRSIKSSQRSCAVSSGASAASTLSAAGTLRMQTGLMTTSPGDLMPLVEDLRLSPHPPPAVPPMPNRDFQLPGIAPGSGSSPHTTAMKCGGENSKNTSAAALYGSSGWPLCTFEFFDRCATLLGPLAGCLTNTSENCRVSIYIPHCESYLKQQIESLLAIEDELRQKEEEEELIGVDEPEDDSLLEDSYYRQEVLGEALPKPPTPPPASTPEPAPPAKGKKGKAPPPPAKTAKGKPQETSAAGHDKRNSLSLLDERAREKLLRLPPTSVNQYHPAGMHLQRLQRLSDRLTQEAVVCRTKYARAEALLSAGVREMVAEMERHKGKEQMRLKADIDGMTASLEEMHRRVVQVEEVSMKVRQEIMGRERNRVVRRARLQQLEGELEQLRRRADRRAPLRVKLWLTGGPSSLPLAVEREDEGPFLPPVASSSNHQQRHAPTTASPSVPFDGTMTPSVARSPYMQPQYLEAKGASAAVQLASGHPPPRDSHVVILEPKDDLYTYYEADFVVPEGFEGVAILLINDQKTIQWKVIASH